MRSDEQSDPRDGEDRALIDEAAHALREGRTRDAFKLVRRALEAAFTDAGVHLKAARLLRGLGEHDVALAALQRALVLAPEAKGALAELRQWGFGPLDTTGFDVTLARAVPRTPRFDRVAAARALGSSGIVVLPRFATAAECAEWAGCGDDDARFVLAQDLATPLGTSSRAVLREPLAADLGLLVAEAYRRAAEIGNDLRATLRSRERYPADEPPPLTSLDRAVRLTLRGGSGYPRRREAGDRQSFPFCGVLALGEAPIEVRLHDTRPGKPRGKQATVAPGALALFCARERPVSIGGITGLQAIEWSLAVPDEGSASALLLAWPHAVSAPQ